MMLLIKGLYTALAIVLGINAITSLRFFGAKVNKPASANAKLKKSDAVLTWKDAIRFAFMVISAIFLILIVIFLSYVLKIRFVMTIIMIAYFLGQIQRSISSAQTVGNIVRGKSSTILGANDYSAIITLALLVCYFNTYGILDKVIGYADSQTNTILSDWILLGCCVTSIAVTTFFICSLMLRPLKIAIKLLCKIFSRFSNEKKVLLHQKLEKKLDVTGPTKNWTVTLIDYNMNQKGAFSRFLWLGIPIAIILDVFWIMVFLVYEMLVLMVWYFMCIEMHIRKMFSSLGKWMLSLSDRDFVAISFRVATILAFGCTAIINQYEPFLLNQESTSVFEFISSTIIIPVILEWVVTYKSKTKNAG